jgi:predicted aspartyl protease
MKASIATLLFMSIVMNSSPAQTITVPLLDDDVSFRVPVRVSGQTNYFLVDTGTSATALDTRFRDRLGEVRNQWDGHNFYRSPEIRMQDVRLGVDEVFCMDMKMFRMITGEPCDGVLGMEFLKHYVVELDFERGIVQFAREVPAHTRTNATRVPMKLSNQRHFRIPTALNGKTTLDLLLDTGDSSTISLKRADWNLVFPPGENAAVHKLLLAGLGKEVTESVLARLASFEVQSNRFANSLCVLSSYETAPSALGMGFFRRHHVTFDFPNQTLYLRPAKAFTAVEEHDMSGLHLLRQEGDTLVHSVDEGSVASRAGVLAGDLLVSFNGQPCSMMRMKAIREALRAADGAKVSLGVKRGEKTFQADFALKRVL